MPILTTRLLVLFALLFGLAAGASAATDSAQAERAALERLLGAIAQNSHAAFVADADDAFAAFPQADFAMLAEHVGPALQGGWQLERLGEIRRQGLTASVWKVTLSASGDDLLATLHLADGKVGGFYLH